MENFFFTPPKRLFIPFFTVLCLCIIGRIAYSQPEFVNQVIQNKPSQTNAEFEIVHIAKGFDIPWGLSFLKDNELIMTERDGSLYLIHLQNLTIKSLTHPLPILVAGQGGLLDVALEPNSQWLYFTYSQQTDRGGITVLAKAQKENQTLKQWQTVLATRSATDTHRHYGSRITFDGKGHIFISVGDRGVRSNGQDLSTHSGKILRLDLNGKAPKDNPFIGQPNALPEIWSYGHRNPQGLFYLEQTQALWSIEHGPRGGDEINLIQAGGNYGWPIVSHGKEYWGPVSVGEAKSKPGMIDPIKVYTPSIAPSSLIIYSGQAFKAWAGQLMSGALKLKHLNMLQLTNDHLNTKETRLLSSLNQRIRDLTEAPNGWVYLSTDAGNLYALRPTPQ